MYRAGTVWVPLVLSMLSLSHRMIWGPTPHQVYAMFSAACLILAAICGLVCDYWWDTRQRRMGR